MNFAPSSFRQLERLVRRQTALFLYQPFLKLLYSSLKRKYVQTEKNIEPRIDAIPHTDRPDSILFRKSINNLIANMMFAGNARKTVFDFIVLIIPNYYFCRLTDRR
jgi:hypothetical protein